MPEKISLSTNLVNNLLAYLGTKPFAEVSQLIQAVQQEAQGQISPPEEAAAE
jgi:hypothetical protein